MYFKMSSNPYIQSVAIIVIVYLVVLLFESINSCINFIGSALIVSIISWKLNEILNRYFGSKRAISSNGKAVVITGCDSGFGNGLAFKLNQLGFHTIALCLNDNSDGVKQLMHRVVFPNRLSVIQVDVTDDSKINESFETISGILRDNSLILWALVNNAGIFHTSLIEWNNTIESYNRAFNVNTLGTIRMTRKYLPLLRESGGRVVNVLSAFSRLSFEGSSAYSASKFAALAFHDSLRKEMYKFGVKVISVEPTCYRTPLINVEGVHSLLDKIWLGTSDEVQNAYGIKAFEKFKRWYAVQTKRARNPAEVVSALSDAIINESPQTRYRCCGLLAAIAWTVGEVLPSQIFDDLVRFIERFDVIIE